MKEEFIGHRYSKKEWHPICSCSEIVSFKDCMLHSCPCGCEMSIADPLYEYYHSDLRDRYTLDEYIIESKKNFPLK
jgi:hypothetical protein